jgi:hypothetical protein
MGEGMNMSPICPSCGESVSSNKTHACSEKTLDWAESLNINPIMTCSLCGENIRSSDWEAHKGGHYLAAEDIAGQEPDAIKRPSHYTQYKGMEPFTFFFLNNIPFAEASVCKYVLRWKKKNGIEDLEKAKRIIEMIIELKTNGDKYKPERSCL